MREKSDIIQDLDPTEGKRLLENGAEALGISLSHRQLGQFIDYLILLCKWNQHINLTGLRSWREIIIKHFLDSLTTLPYLPEEARILDLGSGAGFPGLPIKIARPTQKVTLIDASVKKISFLKEAARHLNLRPITIHRAFLGKGSPNGFKTDPFDIIITRAVGKITDLLTGVSPYLSFRGQLVLMKGRQGVEEISTLTAEIKEKGFRLEEPIVLTLPFLEQKRTLLFLTKVEERNLQLP
ncbi:MAG: 16S rRNA (guanine(527)-N(7))-methyltransferase RsmG [Thermodesulfobacteriota bacterium]